MLLLHPLALVKLSSNITHGLKLTLSLTHLTTLSLTVIVDTLLIGTIKVVNFVKLFTPLLTGVLKTQHLLPQLVLTSLVNTLVL